MKALETESIGIDENKSENGDIIKNDSGKPSIKVEIQAWLINYLSELLEIDSDEIDITIPFERYGLDSQAAIVLTGDLQEWLKCDLNPTLLFDYPTIQALADHLTEKDSP